MISYDPDTCRLVGRIVNVSAEESVLGQNGKVDVRKLRPITFDTMNNQFWFWAKRSDRRSTMACNSGKQRKPGFLPGLHSTFAAHIGRLMAVFLILPIAIASVSRVDFLGTDNYDIW